jgi:hypothetical protein
MERDKNAMKIITKVLHIDTRAHHSTIVILKEGVETGYENQFVCHSGVSAEPVFHNVAICTENVFGRK